MKCSAFFSAAKTSETRGALAAAAGLAAYYSVLAFLTITKLLQDEKTESLKRIDLPTSSGYPNSHVRKKFGFYPED